MKFVIMIVLFAFEAANYEINCSTLPPEKIKKWAEYLDQTRKELRVTSGNQSPQDPVAIFLSELKSNPSWISPAQYKKLIKDVHSEYQKVIMDIFKMIPGLTDGDIENILKYCEREGMYGSRAALWKEYDDIIRSRSLPATEPTNFKGKLRVKALKGKSQQGIEKPSTSRDTSSMEVGAQQPDEDIDQFMKRMGLEEEKKDERKSVESGKSKGKTKKKSKGGKSRT